MKLKFVLSKMRMTRDSWSRCSAASRRPACLERINSKSVRDTKTAVKTFEIRPKNSVVAKPRIGPVPNWKRNAAAMSDETCVSTIVEEHAVEAGGDGLPRALPVASSSRMRSKISTFESTPMPIVRMKPAMPGSVMTAPRYAMKPIRMIRFSAIETNALMPGELVVDEHEERDERRGPMSEAMTPARIESAPSVGADFALFEIGQRRRQRAGAQHERQVGGFLLREAAGDARVGAGDRRPRYAAPTRTWLSSTIASDLADVLASVTRLNFATPSLLSDEADRRLVVFVERRPGVAQVAAGDRRRPCARGRTSARPPAPASVAPWTTCHVGRHLAAVRLQQRRLVGRRAGLDELQLEHAPCCLMMFLARAMSVHARQLHDDLIAGGAVRRDDRLGDAELVDAALDRLDRLRHRLRAALHRDVRLHPERVAAAARAARGRRTSPTCCVGDRAGTADRCRPARPRP